MEKTDYIVDIQAFHDKNGYFLPKEIAVLSTDCNIYSHWLIKPPYDCSEMQKGILASNSYLTCFHHGIEWFDGEADVELVYSALRDVARNALRIYTRGEEKARFLEKILARQIINLEEYRCPSYGNLPRSSDQFCVYHGCKRENFTCALAYAYKLRKWLIKAFQTTELNAAEAKTKKKRNK